MSLCVIPQHLLVVFRGIEAVEGAVLEVEIQYQRISAIILVKLLQDGKVALECTLLAGLHDERRSSVRVGRLVGLVYSSRLDLWIHTSKRAQHRQETPQAGSVRATSMQRIVSGRAHPIAAARLQVQVNDG